MDEPKDLGIKIGSPKEVLWTDLKEFSKKEILRMEVEIELHKGHIKLADKWILEEKEKLKS